MRKMLTWITSPPVLAIPIFILARAFSAEEGSIRIELLILLVLLILALTVLYFWASSRNLALWLVPLQFIAQGIVISVLAIVFVLPFLSWVGVLLTIIGLILSAHMVFQGDRKKDVNTSKLFFYDIFESYPFPACVSDKNGSVISVSSGLTQLVGKSKEEIWQTNIGDLIPPKESVSFGEKLLRTMKKELNDRTWYSLIEEDPRYKNKFTGMFIKDTETDMFSKEYCRIRTEEEIVRIKRYKRWAIFMMVKICFVDGEESINKQYELEFFRSFCVFLKKALRNCDTVSRIEEFSVAIILPETLSEEPMNEVIKKILNFSKELNKEINQLQSKISPSLCYIFYNASYGDISFDGILIALSNCLSEYEYT
jgi:PAS domain S-box-containing protein